MIETNALVDCLRVASNGERSIPVRLKLAHALLPQVADTPAIDALAADELYKDRHPKKRPPIPGGHRTISRRIQPVVTQAI